MPVIQIATLPTKEGLDKPALMRAITADIMEQLNWPGGRVFIYFKNIEPGEFLFAGELSDTVTEHTHHPIVYLHYVEGKSPEVVRTLCEILSGRIAEYMHIAKENVCVIHVPVAHGNFYVHERFL